METLCVLAIILVLAGVAVVPILRALGKAKSTQSESKPHSHQVVEKEWEKL